MGDLEKGTKNEKTQLTKSYVFQGFVNDYGKKHGSLWFYKVLAIRTIENITKLKKNNVFSHNY